MGSVNVNYKMIGLNISTFRHNRNLTQEQLAEKAGISKQFVCNIECGRAIPSLQTIYSLSDALNVDPGDLLRRGATHDPDAPCTLREEHNVFVNTLTDQLFPKEHAEDTYIDPNDLPLFDIILPAPDENA